MEQEDLNTMHELAEAIKRSLPDCRKLQELFETYGRLFMAAVEDKKVVIGEDVCCRTCQYWIPYGRSWDGDKSVEYTRETAPGGTCNEPGMQMHDRHSYPEFFCKQHPFFK